MSQCEPCNSEGVGSVLATGPCEYATGTWTHDLKVCTFRNWKRGPDDFHGERCAGKCRCGRLFCRSHAEAHVHREHAGSTTAECFPRIAASTSERALPAATRLYTNRHPLADASADDWKAAIAVVTDVDPGVSSVQIVASETLRGDPILDPSTATRELIQGIFPSTRFVARVMALAVRALGVAWPRLIEEEDDAAVPVRHPSPGERGVRDALSRWATQDGPPPTPSQIGRLLGAEGTLDNDEVRAARDVAKQGRAARDLAMLLATQPLPPAGVESARWLLGLESVGPGRG